MTKPNAIKRFRGYAFAHRQPKHEGHCALIHGHDWDFEFEFVCDDMDANGFVIDFGRLDFLKEYLNRMFDHTLVISKNDPEIETFNELSKKKLCNLKIVDDVSAEGLAVLIQQAAGELVEFVTKGRVKIKSVTVYEGQNNSCKYAICTCKSSPSQNIPNS